MVVQSNVEVMAFFKFLKCFHWVAECNALCTSRRLAIEVVAPNGYVWVPHEAGGWLGEAGV